MNKTDEEINHVLNRCIEREDEGGSQWPGMTYEQGVAAAIRWLCQDGDHPLDE